MSVDQSESCCMMILEILAVGPRFSCQTKQRQRRQLQIERNMSGRQDEVLHQVENLGS